MYVALFFFFNDTATTEIYTLSLHDALPIFELPEHRVPVGLEQRQPLVLVAVAGPDQPCVLADAPDRHPRRADRKSTRLNSSHANISYAVFCLKKKTQPYLSSTSSSDIHPIV